MNKTQTSSIFRGFGSIALALLFFAGAALSAFVAWFFISDMIGDWYEVNNPEIPKPGQPMPSYWAEHSGFSTVLGFVVWFSPSLALLILAFRFVLRAFSTSIRSAPDAPQPTNIDNQSRVTTSDSVSS
jgi:hypothetical protein